MSDDWKNLENIESPKKNDLTVINSSVGSSEWDFCDSLNGNSSDGWCF